MSGPAGLSVLIAPPISEFTPEAYHEHVRAMYFHKQKAGAKKPGAAEGLAVSRTKAGKLSIRRTAKRRPFAYVTHAEIAGFAAALATNQSDIWNAFKQKKFIIAVSRMAAEQAYAVQTGKPWADSN